MGSIIPCIQQTTGVLVTAQLVANFVFFSHGSVSFRRSQDMGEKSCLLAAKEIVDIYIYIGWNPLDSGFLYSSLAFG